MLHLVSEDSRVKFPHSSVSTTTHPEVGYTPSTKSRVYLTFTSARDIPATCHSSPPRAVHGHVSDSMTVMEQAGALVARPELGVTVTSTEHRKGGGLTEPAMEEGTLGIPAHVCRAATGGVVVSTTPTVSFWSAGGRP